MNTQPSTLAITFDLLSQPMQQRLQRRIAYHDGALAPVIDAIREELVQLDSSPAAQSDAERRSYQAQRALLLAQLAYLAKLEEAQQPHA